MVDLIQFPRGGIVGLSRLLFLLWKKAGNRTTTNVKRGNKQCVLSVYVCRGK